MNQGILSPRGKIEIEHFIDRLSQIEENVIRFDEELWIALVEVAVVSEEENVKIPDENKDIFHYQLIAAR